MNHISLTTLVSCMLAFVMLAGCERAQVPPSGHAAAESGKPLAKAVAPADACEARRAHFDESAGRIVGGEPARPGSAPWQVEIFSSPKYEDADRKYDATLADGDACKIYLAQRASYELAHKCGGAWIGDGWVATAAHCVDNIPGFDGREGNVLIDRRVRLGTQNLTVDDGLFAIDAVVIHAGYSKEKKLDDIALVRVLDDPGIAAFQASGRLVAVPLMGAGDRAFDQGESLRVTGWGWMGQRDEKDDKDMGRLDSAHRLQRNPADLQQLTLNYLPDTLCTKEYDALFGPGTLCAGTLAADGSIEMGKDSCQGDSGGPLTREEDSGRRSLVGVVSNGKGCGAGKPAVYTRMSYYGNWITAAKAAAQSGKVRRVPQPVGASGSH